MAIGKNTMSFADTLVKKTTGKTDIERNTRNTRIACKSKTSTEKVKMTFYIERVSLKKLYDYAYRERTSLTDAFNTVLSVGLKDIEG